MGRPDLPLAAAPTILITLITATPFIILFEFELI